MEYGNRSAFLTHHRRRIAVLFGLLCLGMVGLTGRLVFLMMYRADHYSEMAQDLHQRERAIKAARGRILDANGTVIAANRTVCTISVIHNQVTDSDTVIHSLCENLGMEEAGVRKKVEKRSSREIIRTNVDKETGDRIRELHLAGVKVDEDYKRYYPFDSLASKVLGFTGGDNQGIIGLEVAYEAVLKGKNGIILTMADAAGVELENAFEERIEPVAGADLYLSLDVNIQRYAEQAARTVMERKGAKRVSVIVMDPQNGEIMAMVNVPEFNLNDPFTLNTEEDTALLSVKEKQERLNQMWRNPAINDTYEPGSTFKIITMSAGLEASVVSVNDRFFCPGYKLVDDRRIHCARRTGHGSQSFVEGAQNSCNPVFIEVGLRLGVENYYHYFKEFGLLKKTGVDLPGEAGTIMHKMENMGNVELATVAFGQSFQITPIQLATTVSSLINGGRRITPHFGVSVLSSDGTSGRKLEYPVETGIISEKTSETVRGILEKVVSEGSGRNARIEGCTVGGKTATSQTLPRSANRYISSFLGFMPAEDPQILGLCIIHDPQGVYYGGTIAAPVIKSIFEAVFSIFSFNSLSA